MRDQQFLVVSELYEICLVRAKDRLKLLRENAGDTDSISSGTDSGRKNCIFHSPALSSYLPIRIENLFKKYKYDPGNFTPFIKLTVLLFHYCSVNTFFTNYYFCAFIIIYATIVALCIESTPCVACRQL